MAQTFLPGVTNRNTGVSRREIQVFDPQAWQSRLRRDTWQVYFRGSPVRKSNSATRVLLTLCTFQQHVESHLGKNQTQPKILRAFLFSSQLHFVNVTLHALFHGGHLVMRSKRCAVQNQRMQQGSKRVPCGCAGTSRFSCWARKLPIWKQEVTPGKKMWELLAIGQAWIYPWDKPAGIFKFSSSPAPCAAELVWPKQRVVTWLYTLSSKWRTAGL